MSLYTRHLHDTTSEFINDERHVGKALPGTHVGKIYAHSSLTIPPQTGDSPSHALHRPYD